MVRDAFCSGPVGKWLVTAALAPWWVVRGLVADFVWLRNPLARCTELGRERGMSVVRDWFDWLGGYPFEYARPEAIFVAYRARGFELERVVTARGSVGGNELVFIPRPG